MKQILTLLLFIYTFSITRVHSYYSINLYDFTRELSEYGGYFYASGDFGYDPSGLIVYIGSNQVNLTYVDRYTLYGIVGGGYGYESINIYYYYSNVYSVYDAFYYNSSLCSYDCNYSGECYYGQCYCYYPFQGFNCSQYSGGSSDYSYSEYSSSGGYYPPEEISCDTSNSYIRVDSYESINCSASGIFTCYDNYGGAVCESNSYYSSVSCITNSYGYNSMSCYGSQITCHTSNVRCRVDGYGNLHINNQQSNIKSVSISKDLVDNFVLNEVNLVNPSPSSSSKLILNYFILSTLILLLIML